MGPSPGNWLAAYRADLTLGKTVICIVVAMLYGSSALDKLLGQLGIYATWLSSIAYSQKQLRIFIFFTLRFFFCDYMFSYCMKPSGMCLHIYHSHRLPF